MEKIKRNGVGEYWKERFSEMQLGIFIGSCGIIVAVEYFMIVYMIDKIG